MSARHITGNGISNTTEAWHFCYGDPYARVRTRRLANGYISVRSTRLSPYVTNSVDFIKLDIEGAEYDVLDEIRPKLSAVGAITLKYHQSAGNLAGRKLERIIEILRAGGYRYELLYEAKPVGLDSLPEGTVYQLIIRAVR